MAWPSWTISTCSSRVRHHITWHHPIASCPAPPLGLHSGWSPWITATKKSGISAHTLRASGAFGPGTTCQQRRAIDTVQTLCPLASLCNWSSITFPISWPGEYPCWTWRHLLFMEEQRDCAAEGHVKNEHPWWRLHQNLCRRRRHPWALHLRYRWIFWQCLPDIEWVQWFQQFIPAIRNSAPSNLSWIWSSIGEDYLENWSDPNWTGRSNSTSTSTCTSFATDHIPEELSSWWRQETCQPVRQRSLHRMRRRRKSSIHWNMAHPSWTSSALQRATCHEASWWSSTLDWWNPCIVGLGWCTGFRHHPPSCAAFSTMHKIPMRFGPHHHRASSTARTDSRHHFHWSVRSQRHLTGAWSTLPPRLHGAQHGATQSGIGSVLSDQDLYCLSWSIAFWPGGHWGGSESSLPHSSHPACPLPLWGSWSCGPYAEINHTMAKACLPTGRTNLSSSPARCTGTAFVFNPNAPAFDPAAPVIGYMPENVQDLHQAWQRTAFSWEGESPSTTVVTWFVDQHNPALHHCQVPRVVRLHDNFEHWETNFRQTWQDFALPGAPIMIHVVEPPPSNLDHETAAHVIIIQNPLDQFSTSLITGFDSNANFQGRPVFQLAMTTLEILQRDHLLMAIGLGGRCLFPGSPSQCALRYGNYDIQPGVPFPARDGHGLTIHIFPRPTFLPHQQFTEGPALLQLSALIRDTRVRGRQTTASVAHEQWPLNPDESRSAEHLTVELATVDTTSPQLVPYYLIWCSADDSPPRELYLPEDATAEECEQELETMGYPAHVYRLGHSGNLLCAPIAWRVPETLNHYYYVSESSTDRDSSFLHTATAPMTDLEHMKFLHQMGFPRAVILSTTGIRPRLHQVVYVNNQPTLEQHSKPTKTKTPWTRASIPHRPGPLLALDAIPDSIHANPVLPIDFDLLQRFFNSATDVLCPWHDHLDLPETTRKALADTAPHLQWDQLDRLVIYTDGSSQGKLRRKPPLWVEEFATSDSWAFVVLGERYDRPNQPGSICCLGWQAHNVVYQTDTTHYLGTDHIGSEHAERESLFWAGLWRLALNSNIPTVFRADSLSTTQQASGQCGVTHADKTYLALRATFQALQAGLQEGLTMDHVASHTDEPWNDMVDCLAKLQATQDQKLSRQDVDLRELQPFLPYFWMLLESKAGLPPWSRRGFEVSPPDLPPEARPQPASHPEPSAEVGHYDLSFLTMNVNSLYKGPDGVGGKLSFLRQQVNEHCLNFVGVQEARSDAGVSCVDQCLRFSSGADHGSLGVELWINLAQPFCRLSTGNCRFDKSHFQIVHADPRRLLVRVSHPYWKCLIFVGHGPHTGRADAERTTWWNATNELLRKHRQDLPVFALLDANARTGPVMQPHIQEHDDIENGNSADFRHFLNDLTLPSTGHRHQGSHATWIAPQGMTSQRIDYVAIPVHLMEACVFSSVVESLDLGNARDDHFGVGIQLTWKDVFKSAQRIDMQGCKIPTIERARIKNVQGQPLLQHLVPREWSCDIQTHVTDFNIQLLDTLHSECRPLQHGPKKIYLKDEIWQLRCEKHHIRARLKETRRLSRRHLLAGAFRAWTLQREMPSEQLEQAWTFSASWSCGSVRLMAQFHNTSRKLRQELRHARQECLRATLDQISPNAAAGEILHHLRPFIGPTNLKKLKARALPMIRQGDGQVCATREEARDRWIEYFGQMEGGQRISLNEQWRCWREGLDSFRQIPNFDMLLQDIPSLVELEQAYRRVSLGKATGMDGVPSEVCHYLPVDMAKLTYTMLMKASLYGQESLTHKGGRLVNAYKHKGDPRECSSHRSLLISSHLGKTIHRSLRQHHYELYARYQQRQQVGGRQRMPVTGALHLSRAYLRTQQTAKRPAAMIFLDLTEAFYRVIRPLAVGGRLSDQCIAHMISRLGLQPSDMAELQRHLDQPSAIELAGAPDHVRRLFEAIHQDTWFIVEDQEDVVRTELGSQPGDGFADVIFGFLWGRLLHKLETDLTDLHYLDSFPAEQGLRWNMDTSADSSTVPFLGPTWMDDLCICLSADTNEALIQHIGITMGLLLDHCKGFLMEPNLKRGKTEIMPTFRGAGSRALRRKYFDPTAGAQLPVICETGAHNISIVSRYTHLGGLIHHKDVTKQEISRRLSIAHGAFTHHRKLLYRNQTIPWEKRIELFQTLILSKLTYGLETWTFADQRSRSQFHAGVMRLYRRLHGGKHDAHLRDEELLHHTGLPLPAELLRRARLRYLGTLYQAGDSISWGLINADDAWLELLRSDMEWLWTQISHTSNLGDPHEHFAAWEELLIHYPGYWKKLIKRGLRHAALQRQNEEIVRQFHDRIFTYLEAAGADIDKPAPVKESETEAYGCMSCQRSFNSKAGEGAHMFKRHGVTAQARQLFDGTQCPCCLRDYHSHSQVLGHLRTAHLCRRTLIARGHHCEPAPGAGSRIDSQLLAANDGARPFLQAEGPIPQQAIAQREFDRIDLQVYEDCYLGILDSDNIDDLERALRAAVCAGPLPWTTCKHTLEQLRRDLTEENLGDAPCTLPEVQRVLDVLCHAGRWSFLQKKKETTSRMSSTLQAWEKRATELVLRAQPLLDKPVLERPIGKHRILLHAFSGRRRKGDIEWFLHEVSASRPGHIISVVSLDIVIDKVYGDVGRPATRSTWLQAITERWVIAFIGGPPCNTWSRARHMQQQGGPRVIRAVDSPWGLPSLRLAELDQILMGNLLLGFALECMVLLGIHDGVGALEHPKEPEPDHMVSIWRLPIMQLILLLPHTRLVTFAQGLLGAPSPKPTTMLVLGLPDLEKEFCLGRVTPDLPKGVSVGRDDQGHYRTAPLKEYPPAMCRALALAFARDMTRPCKGVSVSIPDSFHKLVEIMQDREFGVHIGHDGWLWNLSLAAARIATRS